MVMKLKDKMLMTVTDKLLKCSYSWAVQLELPDRFPVSPHQS